ncbi:MAG: single-stranded DNA-binding protein [Bacteroides sp.]|nr:single-stranded DNA-binding protein [Bacteroides sp.]MDD2644799.1 single-stranded DNA-binding protein [Bacteroides sp.]MDD4054605.1 single-stranded DNA-binding protein [Bacteroides sp.]MDD4720084.1 single-stranded DNA-binding protein [Bacteroides sp.]NLI64876.1 single-stranded DNA-binding protein [Bacteroidales bacterium]
MAINKVILIGNVGKDPDVRYLDNGVAVANFPLATSERGYTLANGTQVPERTEWHNLVLWRGLAEVAEKYVNKGDKLYIEGKIRTRSYDDQAGVKRYITEIFVDNLEMLTPRSFSNSSDTNHQQAAKSQNSPTSENPDLPADSVDDLPF